MIEKVESGSIWSGQEGLHFQVISVVEIEGNTWVYYRRFDSKIEESKEYSCYLDSFIHRFRKNPKN